MRRRWRWRAPTAPLRAADVDTLILGCTHYPLVSPMLQRILGRDVRLVAGGHAVAAAVQRTLERDGIARGPADSPEGAYDFLCTGDTAAFREVGTRFLQMPLGEVESGRDRPRSLIRARGILQNRHVPARHACVATVHDPGHAVLTAGNTVILALWPR